MVSSPPGASTPSTSETSAQSELPRANAALWLGASGLPGASCQGWARAPRLQDVRAGEGPSCQLIELQEGVRRLCSIRDGKQKIGWSFSKNLQVAGLKPQLCRQKGRQSPCLWDWEMETTVTAKAGSWWLLVPGGWFLSHLQFRKGISALIVEEVLCYPHVSTCRCVYPQSLQASGASAP